MAATRLANVIVPALWNKYVIERTAELSALFQSGLVQTVEEMGTIAGEGGNLINMPFWQDLTGDDEVVSATGTALTVNAIDSEQDKAVIFARGKAWGVNELAAHLSGSDPAAAIGDLVAAYWARRQQAVTVSILEGLFGTGGALEATHLLDATGVSGANAISASNMLDAQQLLGDAKGRLTAVAMHSATENALAKLNLITYIQPSESSPRVPVYMGKQVVVDDGLPTYSGDVFDTYLFGAGAFGYAEVSNSKLTMTEMDRDALAGEDILINRRHFVLHPRGVAFSATAPTGGGPTNATLATPATWTRVYEAKNIRIVCLRHTL